MARTNHPSNPHLYYDGHVSGGIKPGELLRKGGHHRDPSAFDPRPGAYNPGTHAKLIPAEPTLRGKKKPPKDGQPELVTGGTYHPRHIPANKRTRDGTNRWGAFPSLP